VALLIGLVVLLHAGIVAFAVFGALLALRWPRVAWAQLPCLIWATLILTTSWNCPLTLLEKALRTRGGWPIYSGGYLEHYLHPILIWLGLGPAIPYLGYLVIAINLSAYAALAVRLMRRKNDSEDPAENLPLPGSGL